VNGAQALINTLVESGVDVCFANPGTSEMHFVAALDSVPQMRGVLGLFEGVATGAADGYARIADRPAAVLLHLGPGLGNGLANLHNARRAHVPMVVVVGDHATYHKKYDAPLESDIDALAGSVSGWMHRSTSTADVAADAAQAVAASRAGSQIATLILPADVSWSDGAQAATELPAQPSPANPMLAPEVAEVLRSGEPAVIMVGGDATRWAGLAAATRIAQHTGARLLCETFPTRLERGAGVPAVERLAYFGEAALAQLDGARHLILAGAKSPVSFFAYPDKPSDLVPAGCELHLLAEYTGAADALIALADELAPGSTAPVAELSRPRLPAGALTAVSVADVVGALMPENVIVVDESNTSSIPLTAARPHTTG
jgi:acetolactate synthase-1/2/3 large subunit